MDKLIRWKITGWDKSGNALLPRYIYSEVSYKAVQFARERYCPDYSAAQSSPISAIIPLDMKNLDGVYGYSAEPCDWISGLSKEAKLALICYDKEIFLFRYQGRYVITRWLLTKPRNKRLEPPIAVFRNLDELDGILTQLYDDTAGSQWKA